MFFIEDFHIISLIEPIPENLRISREQNLIEDRSSIRHRFIKLYYFCCLQPIQRHFAELKNLLALFESFLDLVLYKHKGFLFVVRWQVFEYLEDRVKHMQTRLPIFFSETLGGTWDEGRYTHWHISVPYKVQLPGGNNLNKMKSTDTRLIALNICKLS